jgi:chromosome segregation ATPase
MKEPSIDYTRIFPYPAVCVLVCLLLLSSCKTGGEQRGTGAGFDIACVNELRARNEEIMKLREKIRSLESSQRDTHGKTSEKTGNEKKYEKLIRAKNKEIKRLRLQIEALEAIHKNIREKKKKATTP